MFGGIPSIGYGAGNLPARFAIGFGVVAVALWLLTDNSLHAEWRARP